MDAHDRAQDPPSDAHLGRRLLAAVLQIPVVAMAAATRWAWYRFTLLSVVGKAIAVAVALYATAWLVSKLGIYDLGRELASVAVFIGSLIATWLVIRLIWKKWTYPYR